MVLRKETAATWAQMIRYGLAGSVAFVVDLILLVSLTEVAGLHYLLSAAVGFAGGVTISYAFSINWVFHQRSLAARWVEFAVFTSISVIGLALNEAIIWVVTEQGGLHYLLSKMVATAAVFVWNFSAKKTILFS